MEHVKAGHTLTIPSGIKPQLETLLKTCWNMTATKRPTASEIVELLSNNPRLISPCIDVPLASVQVERTDSLELIPSVSWLIVCKGGSVEETRVEYSYFSTLQMQGVAIVLVFFKTKCLLPPKALDRNCFLVYHKTFLIVVLRKKEWAVDIEILMEPASPNQPAQTKNDCSAKSPKGCISKWEISKQQYTS